MTSVQENDIHTHTGYTVSPDRIRMACAKLSNCQGDGKGSACVKIQWYHKHHKKVDIDVDVLKENCVCISTNYKLELFYYNYDYTQVYPTSVKLFCCMKFWFYKM